MHQQQPRLGLKWVEAQQVVGVRQFVKDEIGIRQVIDRLLEAVGDKKSGPPLCRYLDRDEKRGLDVEIGVPVAACVDIDLDGAFCRVIPGDHVLWAAHVGPYVAEDGCAGIVDTARRAWGEIFHSKLLAGDNPRRSVYLEGPERHGNRTSEYVTEVQISYHLPSWIEALRQGIADCAGEDAAATVLAGSERIVDSLDAEEIRTWVRGAMTRVDELLLDAPVRACILNGCAHRHPLPPLERWKAAYEQAGSLERFIERLESDKALYPPRVWREEGGPRNLLYVERVIPESSREAYDGTDDPVMKRYHACFCSMVKDAILKREEISATFCDCSAGWFVQIWEYLLGRTLRVDTVNTVLCGDDRCVFAIHLPKELL